MKTYKYIFHILFVLVIISCNSDEIICETEEPDLPESICDKGLLIMRSEEFGLPLFSLDSLSKPINTPLAFQNIRQDPQDDSQFDVFTRPSNYDAYNKVDNTYFIEFPFEQRLYKYDISAQTRQEFSVAGFYAAPVFANGNLLTITIDNFGYASNPASYSIETINQNDGSLTTLATNAFPLQSYFNWESMSSVTDSNGNVYFVSGSNLIIFNTTTTTTQHLELVPGFDFGTNNQIFYGLEIRNNGNLLAIRDRDNDQGEGLELVEIDINNLLENPTVVFDFMANGIVPNSEFYSTTYDACDDTYYITSRKDASTTDFYEIDLQAGTFQTENFPYYLMGIESKTN